MTSPGPVYDVFDLALKVNSLERRVGIEAVGIT
jgi:hypothetical protein